MSLSPIAFFGLLDENNPRGDDSRTISDDQHRNILASMKQQAPNWTAAITATHGDVNLLSGYVAAGQKPLPGVGGVTKLWFYNNTVPIGWTLSNPDNNLRNLVVAPSGSSGIAGNIDPSSATLPTSSSGTSNNHTLTIAQMPFHDHPGSTTSFSYATNIGGATWQVPGPAVKAFANGVDVAGQGGNQGHSHGITNLPGTATFNPRRAMGVIGTLNA